MSTRHGGTGGAIVNVSSAAARLGAAGEYVDYAASKGALDTFTIGLAQEVATEGIRVNAVRPGNIRSDLAVVAGLSPDSNGCQHSPLASLRSDDDLDDVVSGTQCRKSDIGCDPALPCPLIGPLRDSARESASPCRHDPARGQRRSSRFPMQHQPATPA